MCIIVTFNVVESQLTNLLYLYLSSSGFFFGFFYIKRVLAKGEKINYKINPTCR